MNMNCAWIPSGAQIPDNLFHAQDLRVEIPLESPVRLQSNVSIPLANPPDYTTSTSLVHFINYFGMQTMVIYDAILSDKRIIFAGSRNLSLTQIQNYIFTAASMVSPPLYGIYSKILPYVPLVSMGTLQ